MRCVFKSLSLTLCILAFCAVDSLRILLRSADSLCHPGVTIRRQARPKATVHALRLRPVCHPGRRCHGGRRSFCPVSVGHVAIVGLNYCTQCDAGCPGLCEVPNGEICIFGSFRFFLTMFGVRWLDRCPLPAPLYRSIRRTIPARTKLTSISCCRPCNGTGTSHRGSRAYRICCTVHHRRSFQRKSLMIRQPQHGNVLESPPVQELRSPPQLWGRTAQLALT